MNAPQPEFPLDLSNYMPAGLAATLSLAETGAFFRFAAASWRQVPPCTLPDDPDALAEVAGVSRENWPRLTRLVGALTTRGDDGRLHLPELRSVYDRLLGQAQAARSRTAAATAAAAAKRRSVTDSPSRIIRNGSVTDPLRTAAPFREARAPAERSALQRSSSDEFQRSSSAQGLSASSADVIAKIGSAGARALATDTLRRWQHGQAVRMVAAIIEQWRQADKISSAIPLSKATEIADCPFASPARCAAAIEAVRDAIARDECRSPFGMLTGLIGAVRHPRTPKPMDIPLHVQRRWDEIEAAYLREQAASIATAAAFHERHTGGGPISATGA